jgi:hypothetical protein
MSGISQGLNQAGNWQSVPRQRVGGEPREHLTTPYDLEEPERRESGESRDGRRRLMASGKKGKREGGSVPVQVLGVFPAVDGGAE